MKRTASSSNTTTRTPRKFNPADSLKSLSFEAERTIREDGSNHCRHCQEPFSWYLTVRKGNDSKTVQRPICPSCAQDFELTTAQSNKAITEEEPPEQVNEATTPEAAPRRKMHLEDRLRAFRDVFGLLIDALENGWFSEDDVELLLQRINWKKTSQ